jgi:uncharacterized RDD family membrane protein YckC
VLLHARFGQTIGKMLTSVKVMNVSETAIPSLRQAFLRDVGYIAIDILTLAYFIYLVLGHKYSTGQQQLEDGLIGYDSLHCRRRVVFPRNCDHAHE